MRIFYVEHMHSKGSYGHIQGMMRAYQRVASEFKAFDDRLIARNRGKDVMNELFIKTVLEFKPDFIHLGKCESLRGESIRRVKETTGTAVIHFYPDYRPKVKSYTADIGRQADMTVLQHQDKALWDAHKKAGCKRVGFWWAGTDPERYYPHDVPKEYDIAFMANPPSRGTGRDMGRFTLVNALADAGLSVHIFALVNWARKGLQPHKNIHLHPFVDQEQFALACSKGHIALGYNISTAYMYTSWHRWVNSMASGAFFLGRLFPGLNKVFETGKHLVWFKDIRGAVKLAQYYLAHEGKRERIAKAGRECVLKHHTWDNRVAQMMGYVKQVRK